MSVTIYKNGNYIVKIDSETGTKVRLCKEDTFDPCFPENIDVCITKKCDVGCNWCYEGCTLDGKHGDILSYNIFDSIMPYTEIAINGNDLDHPQLIEFLERVREHKAFVNMTVHQVQFIKNYDKIKKLQEEGLIKGVGVSFSYFSQLFIDKLKSLTNVVVHTINGIISETSLTITVQESPRALAVG